jgi:murein L,D-transpeptidase YcbB/YkuD
MRTLKALRNTLILLSLFTLFIWIKGFASQNNSADQNISLRVGKLIKNRISEAGSSPKLLIGGDPGHASGMLVRFYQKRNFHPGWINNDKLVVQANYLIQAIKDAHLEGLIPDYYHLKTIAALTEKLDTEQKRDLLPDIGNMADLDLLLTDAFLMLSCHFSAGCVNPVTIKAEWFADRGGVDVALVLENALKENNIKETLKNLLPSQDSYSKLRQGLMLYREIVADGGWPAVSDGPSLKKGVEDKRVIELRQRLVVSGDLEDDEGKTGEFFDKLLEQAVLRFQKRHGLKVDGIVGHATLKALLVPVEIRARQIELNMERMRWSSRKLGQRYIIVNIADYSLDVVENDHTILSMKVVVGKPFWHTPVFSKKMTYLVLNPSWNVPKNITIKDILPKIKKDSGYLHKKNFKVLTDWGNTAQEIDPDTIDWSTVTANTFKYRLRQEPGSLNPLGRIKFMLPNRFSVYLHDTPHKGLFARNARSFSHGCIRLEKPVILAEYLLKDDPNWSREKILDSINNGKKENVTISKPIDVHILYLTAWVDENSLLQFRDDIYGRDRRLDESLQKKPPRPMSSGRN